MEIQEFFVPIIELAKYLIKTHNAKQQQRINELPVVTVSDLSSCLQAAVAIT